MSRPSWPRPATIAVAAATLVLGVIASPARAGHCPPQLYQVVQGYMIDPQTAVSPPTSQASPSPQGLGSSQSLANPVAATPTLSAAAPQLVQMPVMTYTVQLLGAAPAPAAAAPTLGLSQPTLGLSQPTLGVGQPTLGLSQPTLGVGQPTVGVTQVHYVPVLGVAAPAQAVQAPVVGQQVVGARPVQVLIPYKRHRLRDCFK